MGASAKNEIFYKDMNISDINVVIHLLRYRRDFDRYYKGEINQELIVLLASLDMILKNLSLTDTQKEVLHLLNAGFTYSDISRLTYKTRQTIRGIFYSIAKAVVNENNKRWKKVTTRSGSKNGINKILSN